MTSPDLAIVEPEACPYLGLLDDPRSRFTFASPGHRCHVRSKLFAIDLGHQGSHCLTTGYPACERFPSPKAAARGGSDLPSAAALTAPVVTAPRAVGRVDAGPPADGAAGWGRGLRRGVAVLAALTLVALVAAIGMGALVGSSAPGGAPGGIASPSAAATLAATPASSSTPSSAPTSTPFPSPSAPPAPPATPAPSPIVHVVVKGETLLSIAELHGVTVHAIREANGIDDPSLIIVGQKLVIPAP